MGTLFLDFLIFYLLCLLLQQKTFPIYLYPESVAHYLLFIPRSQNWLLPINFQFFHENVILYLENIKA